MDFIDSIAQSAAVDKLLSGTTSSSQMEASSTFANVGSVDDRKRGEFINTSYAMGLANSSSRPKFKFMFRVEFLFYPGALELFGEDSKPWREGISFLVKSIDRPKIDFEFEEVNRYNHKTGVLKNIKHRDISVSMLDDSGNRTFSMFRYLLNIHQPVVRNSLKSSFNIADIMTEINSPSSFVDSDSVPSPISGMSFTENKSVNRSDTGNYAPANTPYGSMLKAIKVSQIASNAVGSDLHDIGREHVFFFVNPRFKSLDFGNLTYETGNEYSTVDFTFEYDHLVMTDMQSLATLTDDHNTFKNFKIAGEPNPNRQTIHSYDPAAFKSVGLPSGRGGLGGALEFPSLSLGEKLLNGVANVALNKVNASANRFIQKEVTKLNKKLGEIEAKLKKIPIIKHFTSVTGQQEINQFSSGFNNGRIQFSDFQAKQPKKTDLVDSVAPQENATSATISSTTEN